VMTWPADVPGLDADGLAAVEVARAVLGGTASGAEQGSRSLSFHPAPLKAGTFKVDTGGRALAPLLSMAIVPLSLSGGTSRLRMEGVTHGSEGRTFHDVAYGWLPVAERIGVAAEMVLACAGFEADNGGTAEVRVFPAPRLNGIDIGARGLLIETQAQALVANLGIGIALPLEKRLSERLRASGIAAQVEVLPLPAAKARGLAAVIVAQFEKMRTAVVATGRAGRTAEAVADDAVGAFQDLLRRRGALPGGVAEELIVPLAIAASPHGAPGVIGKDPPSPSRITTGEITPSLLTIADVARRMLQVDIQIQGLPGDDGAIEIRPVA